MEKPRTARNGFHNEIKISGLVCGQLLEYIAGILLSTAIDALYCDSVAIQIDDAYVRYPWLT